MVRGDLVRVIEGYLTQGYAPGQVRQSLVAAGWAPSDVDEAIARTQSRWRHFPKIAGALAVCALLAVLVFASWSYLFGGLSGASLLDLSLEPIKTDVMPGASIDFIVQLVNLGSSKRVDVVLKSELVSIASNEVVAGKTETVAVETRNAVRSSLHAPEDAKPGRFVVRTLASYEGKSARASFSVRLLESGKPVKPVGPPEVPPVGPPVVLPVGGSECRRGCNDYDPCTRDRCEEDRCVFESMKPCCGNRFCESGESSDACAEDCAPARTSMTESVQAVMDRAFEAAKTDIQAGVRLCKTLPQSSDHDRCLAGVAKRSGAPDLCGQIVADKDRDGCYLDIALARDRYDVCGKVIDRWLKSSCFSYGSLKSAGG